MNVFAWIALAYLALGALLTVANVGKRKEPTTPGVAALALVFTGLLAWCIVLAATN